MAQRVLIIGGGFAGIALALELAKRRPAELSVRLISDKPHFEYHPALYRVVTGRSPLEVCIPLTAIFAGKNIDWQVDTIEKVDPAAKTAFGRGGRAYPYDYLVLALGSETTYFNIPGLEQFSFGFKSIREARRLKEHLHGLFAACAASSDAEEKVCLMHLVVVGGGPSGVELAGELSVYIKRLAQRHKIDPAFITIDLIEAAPRILPAFPQAVSARVAERLGELGVNIFTNRSMLKEELDEVILRGMTMKTETVVWTAGVKPNSLYQKISGLQLDKRGRVAVDRYLRARGRNDIFIAGDGAATTYAGMAQTAVADGKLIAENLRRAVRGQELKAHQPKKPYYSVPVGPGWAATLLGSTAVYGRTGWFFRRLADLRYFLSILPRRQAFLAFQNGKRLTEECDICLPAQMRYTPHQ